MASPEFRGIGFTSKENPMGDGDAQRGAPLDTRVVCPPEHYGAMRDDPFSAQGEPVTGRRDGPNH